MMESIGKKQIPLRVSSELYDELANIASSDFRSLNSEIEYILSEYVHRRKFGAKSSELVDKERD